MLQSRSELKAQEKIIQEYSTVIAKSGKVLFRDLQKKSGIEAIGLIENFSPEKMPPNPNRADWKMTVVLTDPSLLAGGNINVNIFNRNNFFVAVEKKDILLMKNCNGDDFNGGTVSCNNFSSFALFRGEEQVDVAPAKKCELSQGDLEAVNYLRKWDNTRQPSATTYLSKNSRSRLQTNEIPLDQNDWFDYIGMVVNYVPSETTGKNAKSYLTLTDYTKNPLPPTGWAGLENLDITDDFLLPIALWDRHATDYENWQHGDFVYVENLRPDRRMYLGADLKGNDYDRPFVRRLDENDERLLPLFERKRNVEKHFAEKRLLESLSIRTKVNSSLEKKNIEDVLAQQTIGPFKAIANIIRFTPSNPGDWLRFYCPACKLWSDDDICSKCQYFNDSFFNFDITLNSGDGFYLTAKVEGKDAAEFLGLAPEELFESPVLLEKLAKTARILSSQAIPIYLEFGIEGYFSEENGVRGFRIYQTKLITEEDDDEE